ncbi:MAG TPA: hypothetical protein VMJ33_02865 [Gallionella sp.]|nr:hypothetical protein [Gallionella sp.]
MKVRNLLLPAGLAVFMAACAMPQGSSYYSDYDQPFEDDFFDYQGTPSYEGYYYERIIFLGNIPYYVDDYRMIRPIPPYLYDRFRVYPYSTFGPPVFSRDRRMRDGYPLSSIVYFNGIPYSVGNDRIARPVPDRLQPHFRYPSPNHGNDPRYGDHRPPYGPHDNGRNNDPALYGHDPDYNPYRNERGMHGPDREQADPFGSAQSKGGKDTSADPRYRTPPAYADPRNQPGPQTTSSAGEHPDNANAAKPDKQKTVQQDNQGDSAQADDGGDKGTSRNSRSGSDDDQGNNDRGYYNRRN